ncbi:MAG: glycosyltransferase [Paludibacteraceae bacterium]|nr:glycosyltransferase [Paludibacteraceae bacterium]MBQ8715137.1 glycosyltransferase [Prevotella sp.]
MTNDTTKNTNIQLSVVIVVHDEDLALEQNLPLFLNAECNTAYEVIVVDDASTDRTPDVLKQFKEDYPALHTTFLPKSVPNPSRTQLALYIGTKAAKSDWIVFADIHRPPTSSEWIDGFARETASANVEVTMIYTDRKLPEMVNFSSFQQLEDAAPIIQKAERHSGKGHKGCLIKRRRGLYDAVAIHRECIYDAIRLYDQHIKGGKLIGLRVLIFWKN